AWLEDYYVSVEGQHWQEHSVRTYVAGALAFLRFLERRRWLSEPVQVLVDNDREVAPKLEYRAPRTTIAAAQLIVWLASMRPPIRERERICPAVTCLQHASTCLGRPQINTLLGHVVGVVLALPALRTEGQHHQFVAARRCICARHPASSILW